MSLLQLSQKQTSTSRRPRAATFYVARESADIRWRVELPVRHLKAKLVSWREKQAKYELMNPNEFKFPWRLEGETAIYPEHEGTAVWTRPDMIRAAHGAAMAAQG